MIERICGLRSGSRALVQGTSHGLRVLGLHEFPNIWKNMRGMECFGGPGGDGMRGS